jgi:polygalacturonase
MTKSEADKKIEEIIAGIEEAQIPSDTLDIIEFSGYKPDEAGTVDFHPYINSAIDSLAARGGGWILFRNTRPLEDWIKFTETYQVRGSIELKSNVGILIDRSVRLFFPFDPVRYLDQGKGVLTRYEGTTIYSFAPLIRAFNQENIAIKARGESGAIPVIDGDGENWQRWMWEGEAERVRRGLKPSYQLLKDVNNADIPIVERIYIDPGNDFFRPHTMEFFLCKKVLVDGVKINRSPFWCVKPVFSQSCVFRNMYFDAMVVNNDGIDPESSKNILIENITFGNHDDNVAIKAGRDKEGRDGAIVAGTELESIESEYINDGRIKGPTENVVIRNCVFNGHYAICIGSEMSGGVRNVFAVDNMSAGTVNMGVFIKSSRLRGGTVENIYIPGIAP